MLVSSVLGASVASGAMYGALAGFAVGLLLGLDGLEAIVRLWS
jgi:hypothetical protein